MNAASRPFDRFSDCRSLDNRPNDGGYGHESAYDRLLQYISTIVRRAAGFRPDRFTLLLAAFAVLGVVLVLLRVYNGVGVVGDGKNYIRMAGKLLTAENWLLWDRNFNANWPPAYPTMLALASGFTFDLRSVVGPLNAAAFGMTVFIAGHWIRHRIKSLFLAMIGALAVLVSIPVVWIASYAFSEGIFILLTTLALFQGDRYLQSGKTSSLIWSAVFTALAFLTRYAGVSIIMALAPLFLLQRTESLPEKARRVGLYIAISIAPTGLYILRNFLLLDTLTGSRGSSSYSVPFNAQRALETITGWNPLAMDYFPSIVRTPEATFVVLLALAAVVGYGVIRWAQNANDTHENSFLPVAGSFAFVYLAFMVVGTTVNNSDSSFLDSRLLSPMYVPLALAIVCAIEKFSQYLSELMRVDWIAGRARISELKGVRALGRLSSAILAGLLLLCVLYAGYITIRDTWTAVVTPAIGWNSYGWNAENMRIDASSVDDYLRDFTGGAEPIVRSRFDLYLTEEMLIYVREACSEEDEVPRIFLHVTPVDRINLPGIRKQYGNENFDFHFDNQGIILGDKCLAVAPLPEYEIEYISTGQHTGDHRHWWVTFDLDE